jgi:hypothetical protein
MYINTSGGSGCSSGSGSSGSGSSSGWETLLEQDDIIISELPVGRSPVGILCAHCTIEVQSNYAAKNLPMLMLLLILMLIISKYIQIGDNHN